MSLKTFKFLRQAHPQKISVRFATTQRKLVDTSVWEGKVFNGEWAAPPGGSHPVIEPATGETLFEVGQATVDYTNKAIEDAAAAQRQWAETPARERSAVLRRAALILEEQAESAVNLLGRESGSTRIKALLEVHESIAIINRAATLPLHNEGEVYPSAKGRLSYASRKPLGVVGVISPFNFPMYLGMRNVAPALALGNAVVLKPDPRTAFSGGVLIASAFELAGLPKGVLHVFSGGGDIGNAIVVHPKVPLITFTGSTGAGRKIGEQAGKHLKKVSLELGGKNPIIVLEDADLDRAASAVAFGAYFHQGQICMATGRVIVHKSIAKEFTKRLVAKAQNLKVGNPVDETVAVGPIIDEKQLQHVADVVDASVKDGAKIETGGTHKGPFYAPTVLSNVKPGVRSYHEEVFGPVLSVITFETDAEAIAFANDNEFGLSAAVLSSDIGRAMTIGHEIESGLLHINDQTVLDNVCNPFGGVKASGNGTSVSGPADLELYTHWKWVTINTEIQPYPF